MSKKSNFSNGAGKFFRDSGKRLDPRENTRRVTDVVLDNVIDGGKRLVDYTESAVVGAQEIVSSVADVVVTRVVDHVAYVVDAFVGEDATEELMKPIPTNISYADAYYIAGIPLNKLGKYEDAIEAYDKALERDPDNALYLCAKGKLLQRMGREQEALKCFNKAYEISQSGNLGSNLSQGNISYINSTVSTDREKLLLKVKELQEQSMQIDEEISKLEASNDNEDAKEMLRQRSNSFKVQKTEIINEAIDLLDPENKATEQESVRMIEKLTSLIAEVQKEVEILKERNIDIESKLASVEVKVDEDHAHLEAQDFQIKDIVLDVEDAEHTLTLLESVTESLEKNKEDLKLSDNNALNAQKTTSSVQSIIHQDSRSSKSYDVINLSGEGRVEDRSIDNHLPFTVEPNNTSISEFLHHSTHVNPNQTKNNTDNTEQAYHTTIIGDHMQDCSD